MASSPTGASKRSGAGRRIPGELRAHLRTEGRYTSDDLRTWDSWFDNAWPTSTEEHIAFVDSVRDESNPLSGHFYIPDADPALLTDDAEAFKSRPKQTSFRSIADEIKPVELITHPGFTDKQRRAAVRQQSREEDGDLFAVQPDHIPTRVPDMRIFVYNIVLNDKREKIGEWVAARVIRAAKKGDKLKDKRGRSYQVSLSWWIAQYFDGEQLPMPLSESLFKTKVAGNGWVLDVLHDKQPPEVVPFCEKGRRAREQKQARKKPLVPNSDGDDGSAQGEEDSEVEDEDEEDEADEEDDDDEADGEDDEGQWRTGWLWCTVPSLKMSATVPLGMDVGDDTDGSEDGTSDGGDDDDGTGGDEPDDESGVADAEMEHGGTGGEDDAAPVYDIDAPFPVDYQPPSDGKNPARRLRSSLFRSVEDDEREPLLCIGEPISGGRNMCWARALAGETEGDVGDLLAVADQMSECLLNITGEEAKELADAQTDSVVRGKLRLRTLVAAGSNMASQIGFMRRNATYCWSNEHYPVGVPNILIWAHAKGRCVIVIEAKVKRKPSDPCLGFFATMYGQQTSRCITESELRQFLIKRRPQDRLVFLDSWASMQQGGGHYSHHLTAADQTHRTRTNATAQAHHDKAQTDGHGGVSA